MITLVSAFIFGPMVLYFIYREHAATQGRRIEILPRNFCKTCREWFLDLKDEAAVAPGRGSHWQPTETFRETNNPSYYVPPLPRHLLQLLGVDSSITVAKARESRLSLRNSDGATPCRIRDSYASPQEDAEVGVAHFWTRG